jgi:hypothetical protein
MMGRPSEKRNFNILLLPGFQTAFCLFCGGNLHHALQLTALLSALLSVSLA